MGRARIATITLKTTMPDEVARFWRDLLGYRVAPNRSDSIMLIGDAAEPVLLVQPSTVAPEPGAMHLDLRPSDLAACRARALDLGASEHDIGQTGEEGWVVMADPAGNLFCILQSELDHDAARRSDPGAATPLD